MCNTLSGILAAGRRCRLCIIYEKFDGMFACMAHVLNDAL